MAVGDMVLGVTTDQSVENEEPLVSAVRRRKPQDLWKTENGTSMSKYFFIPKSHLGSSQRER